MRQRQSRPYSIRLPNQLRVALQQKAELTGIRPGTLVVFAIAQFLDPEKAETLKSSS